MSADRARDPAQERENRRELDQLAERMRADIAAFVFGPWAARLGRGWRDGHDFVALNPLRPDRHPGSFRIALSGGYQGMVTDFAGCVKPGDARQSVSPLTFHLWLGFTIPEAKARLGIDGRDPDALRRARDALEKFRARAGQDENEAAERLKSARWIYFGDGVSADIRGTPAESYLRGRGIDLSRLAYPVRALRFRADCPLGRRAKRPALLAPIVRGSAFVAVHRTFLDEAGGRWVKARDLDDPKLSLGTFAGGAIRLWNGERVDAKTGEIRYGRRLSEEREPFWLDLTEGIEDGLSVAVALPDRRVWCGVSSGNMAGLTLPPLCEGVRFWRQNKDAPDSPAAKKFGQSIENVRAQGKRALVISLPQEWGDPNEVLQGGGNP